MRVASCGQRKAARQRPFVPCVGRNGLACSQGGVTVSGTRRDAVGTLMSGLTRLIGVRGLLLAALVYWILISVFMLAVRGEELDLEAVFPLVGNDGGSGATTSDAPTPPNPPRPVVAAFWTVGVIIGLPAALSAKVAAAALRFSSVIVGVCLLVTILRLGILLAPVLAIQLLALHRRNATDSP